MVLADASLRIPAPTPKSRNGAEFDSAQPMANLFEQCLLITCDALVMMLMEKKVTNASEMFLHHANLE
jgi:6-phospho-3-hexuloisomerase